MGNIKIHLDGRLNDYTVRSLHKHNRTQPDAPVPFMSATSDSLTTHTCEVADITIFGAIVLIDRNIDLPGSRLKIILQADTINAAHDKVIDAEIRRIDIHELSGHVRLDLVFTNLNRAERQQLKAGLLVVKLSGSPGFRCLLAAA